MANDDGKEALSILRAVLALGRRLRAERPPGAATLSGISILGTLSRLGPMAATRLAAEERLQPQSLTRIVASLEAGGLIARERSAADRRAIVIALTQQGRTVLANDLWARRRWLQRAMKAALDKDERTTLIAASEAMLKLAFHDDGGEDGKA
jgi:DNA-binding MarR family transcriptional regulator